VDVSRTLSTCTWTWFGPPLGWTPLPHQHRHQRPPPLAIGRGGTAPPTWTGSYFPEWLLERRKRESALISVVATCYLLGVSTRRMDKLVQTLGINSLSKSQVSRMAADLDAQVTAFRTRALADSGPFTFVALTR
jgi:Transposase, Mutator family